MKPIIDKTLKLLENAEPKLAASHCLVGFDGYVDQIIRVVDKRQKDGTATFIETIKAFGHRIQAAAGKSSKFELNVQQTKLGGNGPIMANALAHYGLPLIYMGVVGSPEIHPVFRPMEKICKLVSIGESCCTDAYEFNDGKIMLSRQEPADRINWETIEKTAGARQFFEWLDQADLVALNNWASTPHMTEIWDRIQKDFCPRFSRKTRSFFIDLADPEFRLADDIRAALGCIGRFAQWFDTTLGLNQKEALEIMEVLGEKPRGNDRDQVRYMAETIRKTIGIQGVVVHPTAYAAAASAEGSALVEGPFIERPLISTGAGDHFNAGYALAGLLGGDLEQRLQLGVASSGFYVRTAQSATLSDQRQFLKEVGQGLREKV
ncbi:MAG: PfkB family carbohydrate kinase [Verrucomicrobiae bacterium]|nr:PfkB family carbohydrate kinase [Verrucomicrobiae bacterium]